MLDDINKGRERLLRALASTVGHLRFPVLAGLTAVSLMGSGTQLVGLPLINQADVIEAWFAGQAEFGSEQKLSGGQTFRTAMWNTSRPGNCSIKDAAMTITGDGNVKFSARVKSKDDDDTYCVILHLFNQRGLELWSSSKLCTSFELQDEFASWGDNTASLPKASYGFISFATREDYC